MNWRSLTVWDLIAEARNFRERAFVRLLGQIVPSPIERGPPRDVQIFIAGSTWSLSLRKWNLAGIMAASKAVPLLNWKLKHLPLTVGGPPGGNPMLHPALQDLADMVAVEAERAFYADYFPGVPEESVPAEHVRQVMQALQREMDREALRRNRQPVRFEDLPWERQVALAERRRMWFRRFGITPNTWRRGTWNVWRVTNMEAPEWMQGKLEPFGGSGRPWL